MSIPDEYLILDTRSKEHFKVQTYSNYLKKDVISVFQKKILEGEIEQTCYWAVELILSLAIDTLIDKILMVAIKYVNTACPQIPFYIWSKIEFFMDNLKRPEELRNNQVFRNHIVEICVILCGSSKGKALGLDSQIKKNLDFTNITKHLEATRNYLESVKRADDPEDLSIFMNELGHSMTNKNFDKAIMWLTYIIHFDKIVKKSKNVLVASMRNHGKDGTHIIWYVWELIITLSRSQLSKDSMKQVKSLYYIQKKRGWKSSEIYLVIAAIKFNTHICNFKTPLFSHFSVQAASRVNFLFLEAKQFENNKIDITKHITNVSFKRDKKKPVKANDKKKLQEKIDRKLQQTQMIDTIIQKKSTPTTRTISNLIDIQKRII